MMKRIMRESGREVVKTEQASERKAGEGESHRIMDMINSNDPEGLEEMWRKETEETKAKIEE